MKSNKIQRKLSKGKNVNQIKELANSSVVNEIFESFQIFHDFYI